MFAGLKHSAGATARKAGLLSGGLLCVIVGAGFLTTAAWIYLASAFDPLMAAVVIGGIYTGVGLVTIGASLSSGSTTARHTTTQAAPVKSPVEDAPPLMQAFLFGLQAGANSERRQS